jgi:DNA repair exonuclease SbcCD ATPase subunit
VGLTDKFAEKIFKQLAPNVLELVKSELKKALSEADVRMEIRRAVRDHLEATRDELLGLQRSNQELLDTLADLLDGVDGFNSRLRTLESRFHSAELAVIVNAGDG